MQQNSAPPSLEPPQAPRTIIVTEPSRDKGFTFRRPHLVAACGAALIVAFFLPWLRVFFTDVSGFNLAKDGGNSTLLWAMPVFGGIACIAGALNHKNYKTAAAVAGIVPFAILGYALTKTNTDLFKALTPGAWFGLAAGAGIFLAAGGKR